MKPLSADLDGKFPNCTPRIAEAELASAFLPGHAPNAKSRVASGCHRIRRRLKTARRRIRSKRAEFVMSINEHQLIAFDLPGIELSERKAGSQMKLG
jgi:hypothetical protein